MLTIAGLSQESTAFGGGFGSEAFHSFLHEAYADSIVQRGGLGIADAVYRHLHRGAEDG